MGSIISKVYNKIIDVLRFIIGNGFKFWFTLTFLFCVIMTALTCKIVNFFGFIFRISPGKQTEICAMACRFFFKLIVKLNPQVSLVTYDGKPLPWDEMFREGANAPMVLVNHTSQFDAFVFTASIPYRHIQKMRTLAKVGLFKLPIFGGMLRSVGHFPVHFNSSKTGNFSVDKDKQAKVMEEVTKHITIGKGGLAYYPEGQINRKNAEELQDFRRGSFKMALEHNMDLWAFLHTNVEDVWPHDHSLGGFSSKIYVKLVKLPTIPKHLDLPEYTNSVRSIMQHELDLLVALEAESLSNVEIAERELSIAKEIEVLIKLAEHNHVLKKKELSEIQEKEKELESFIKDSHQSSSEKKASD